MIITKKNFQTTRQNTNIRDSIANIITTDIKFSKAQIYKITQPGRFLGPWLNRFVKNVVTATCSAREKTIGLVNNIASNAASNANIWKMNK